MTDDDTPPEDATEESGDSGTPAAPREPSEGVRIIGAQEAAEATGRHDVVSRRDRDKRYGERPDTPSDKPDLPKITISTTEDPGATAADRFGAVPIVPSPDSEPREPGDGGGHARVAPGEPLFEDPSEFEEEADDDSFVLPHWTEPATGQVPKVVADSDDDPDPTGQQRWKDLSEDQGSGFEDLLDDGPRLGALGGAATTDVDDDDGVIGDDEPYFDDEPEGDPLTAFSPREAQDPDAPRRERSERPRRREGPGGGGSGGGRGSDSSSGDRNLPVAVGVGVGLVALGLICFSLGTIPTMLLATAVVGIAGFEYFSAVRDIGYNPATLLGLVALVGLMVGPALFGLAAYPTVLAIVALGAMIWFLLVSPGEGSVPNLGITLLGITWIGVLGSFAGLFLGLGDVVADRAGLDSNPGIGVLIAAVIAAVSHDIGGYFIG
ncbi:MAG: phosphatidate cytidylyltransferase, partial [Microthrixaceae bacterium]